ncbi:MAG: hypothetical protein AAGA60_30245 [Cyanobacteria bacterium P01_E01_bin.42]
MIPKTIRYGHTHSLPGYRNDRLDIEAKVENWEDVDQCYIFLKKKVREMLGASFDGDPREQLAEEVTTLNETIANRKAELLEIGRKLVDVREKSDVALKHLKKMSQYKKVRVAIKNEEEDLYSLKAKAEGEDFSLDIDDFTTFVCSSVDAINTVLDSLKQEVPPTNSEQAQGSNNPSTFEFGISQPHTANEMDEGARRCCGGSCDEDGAWGDEDEWDDDPL